VNERTNNVPEKTNRTPENEMRKADWWVIRAVKVEGCAGIRFFGANLQIEGVEISYVVYPTPLGECREYAKM